MSRKDYLKRHLYVKNLRNLSEASFDFRSINILTGPNNSGKSSILKALLFFQEQFNSDLLNGLIGFIEPANEHQIYAASDVIRHGEHEFSIEYTVPFFNPRRKVNIEKNQGFLPGQMVLNYNFEENTSRFTLDSMTWTIRIEDESHILFRLVRENGDYIGRVNASIMLNLMQSSDGFISMLLERNCFIGNYPTSLLEKVDREKLLLSELSDLIAFYGSNLNLHLNESKEKFETAFSAIIYNRDTFPQTQKYLSAFGFELPGKQLESLKIQGTLHGLLSNSALGLGAYLTAGLFTEILTANFYKRKVNFLYVPAIRVIPSKYFTRRDSIGASFYQNCKELYLKPMSVAERMFVSKWLEKFDLGDEIEIGLTDQEHINVRLRRNGRFSELHKLGLGTNQLVPILLACVVAMRSEPDLVIIEEPEAHLHPKTQSVLADFFLSVADMSPAIKLIIETHSEYLIRKGQYLVATLPPASPDDKFLNNEELGISHSDILIYYFFGNGEYKKITVDANGILSDEFGKGFLDEADDLAITLFRHSKISNN